MIVSKIKKYGPASLCFGTAIFCTIGGVIPLKGGTRVLRSESPGVFFLICGLFCLLGVLALFRDRKKEPIQSPVPTRGNGT